jgi:hypothetical protein
MPLSFVQPTGDVLAALAHGIERDQEPPPEIGWWYPIYTLAIGDVRQGLWRPIGPIGTRALTVRDGRATGAYEVSAGPDGMPHVSHRVLEAAFLEGATQVIAEAERIAGNRNYEFRLLRAPYLHLAAAWLHAPHRAEHWKGIANGGESDLVLPIDPYPAQLGSRQTWRPEGLMPTLLDIALDLENGPQPPNSPA